MKILIATIAVFLSVEASDIRWGPNKGYMVANLDRLKQDQARESFQRQPPYPELIDVMRTYNTNPFNFWYHPYSTKMYRTDPIRHYWPPTKSDDYPSRPYRPEAPEAYSNEPKSLANIPYEEAPVPRDYYSRRPAHLYPTKTYHPYPIKTYHPYPIKTYHPYPIKTYHPYPIRTYHPAQTYKNSAPIKSYHPYPIRTYHPYPIKTYHPYPTPTYHPYPTQTYHPYPLKTYHSAPIKSNRPYPSETYHSYPIKSYHPYPIKTYPHPMETCDYPTRSYPYSTVPYHSHPVKRQQTNERTYLSKPYNPFLITSYPVQYPLKPRSSSRPHQLNANAHNWHTNKPYNRVPLQSDRSSKIPIHPAPVKSNYPTKKSNHESPIKSDRVVPIEMEHALELFSPVKPESEKPRIRLYRPKVNKVDHRQVKSKLPLPMLAMEPKKPSETPPIPKDLNDLLMLLGNIDFSEIIPDETK